MQDGERRSGRMSGCLRLVRRASLSLPWAPLMILLWPGRVYSFDILSHFSMHIAAMIVCCAIGLCLARRKIGCANCALAAIVILVVCRWWTIAPARAAAPARGEAQFKVVHYNAYAHASRHDTQFAEWLRDQDPDIVVIVDAPWRYVDAQPWLAERYPYWVEPGPAFQWPMIILSKHPLLPASEVFEFPNYDASASKSFTAQRAPVVAVPGAGHFLISALHPPSPRTSKSWRSSLAIARREAAMIRAWREGTELGALVTGDFNSTPTGRVHRIFALESGLQGWSQMFGGGTWPSSRSPWLSLPIDRIWTNRGMVVRSLEVGPMFASDHRPLVAVIGVSP